MKRDKKWTFIEIVWLFIVGALIGFALETLWHYFKNGEIINKQGLLYGPFKPIYGFGLILIILVMNRFKDWSKVKKFIVGCILGAMFEFSCSLFLEYVFKTRAWDYSSFNYNIGGRVYLPYCLAWGLITVICVDIIYPLLIKVLNKINFKALYVVTIIIGIFMSTNILLTSLANIRYAQRTNNNESNLVVFKIMDEICSDECMHKKFPKTKVIKD